MSTTTDPIVLTIQAMASTRPVSIRLRILLKRILRDQQFRCVGITGGDPSTWGKPTIDVVPVCPTGHNPNAGGTQQPSKADVVPVATKGPGQKSAGNATTFESDTTGDIGKAVPK